MVQQIFTAAPPFAMGMFDRYCSADTLLHFPSLYKSSQNSELFNVKVRHSSTNKPCCLGLKYGTVYSLFGRCVPLRIFSLTGSSQIHTSPFLPTLLALARREIYCSIVLCRLLSFHLHFDRYQNKDHVQCESKKSPLRFSDIFSQTDEKFFNHFLHTYHTFLSTLEYIFLFNYLQL